MSDTKTREERIEESLTMDEETTCDSCSNQSDKDPNES